MDTQTATTAQDAPQDVQTTATPQAQEGQTPISGEPNAFANLIDNFAQNFAPQQPQQPQAGQPQALQSESDWMRSVLQQQGQQPQAPQTQAAQQQAEMFAALQAQMAQNTQVQQMAATLQTIATQQQQAQIRADIDTLKGKYASFDERAIQNKLVELAKANPATASAFDNKQGWEILHLAYFANTQPKADPIVSGAQGSAAAPNADLVKSLELGDNSNLEQIGKLF